VAVAQQGIPSAVKFRVSDDVDSPVTNVAVDGCFLDVSQSGARDRFNGSTDTNGHFLAKGEALIGVYARFVHNGYYSTTVRHMLDLKPRKDGKGWEQTRWEVEIPVLLKRIRKPIPLYGKTVEYVEMRKKSKDKVGPYTLSSLVAYDLQKGEMLPPDGKGEVSDIGFEWKMAIHATNKLGRALDYDTLCEVRMTNVVDGIRRGALDGGIGEHRDEGSAYISAYEAPREGYTNAITFYRNVRGTKAESNDDQHYLYYFRIRTQTNEMGQVTNAFYGKIYGQINGSFTYFLNPTPNDRNVEFDPKRNLFTNLGEFEQADRP
jgi:hypothetical protein